jgi:hypothetical protein
MALHLLALPAAELAGLQQDLIGDADLADVVHRRRREQQLGALVVEAELAAEEGADCGDPVDVPAGFGVAQLDRHSQPFDRLVAGGTQLPDRIPIGAVAIAIAVAVGRCGLLLCQLQPVAALYLPLQRPLALSPGTIADVTNRDREQVPVLDQSVAGLGEEFVAVLA